MKTIRFYKLSSFYDSDLLGDYDENKPINFYGLEYTVLPKELDIPNKSTKFRSDIYSIEFIKKINLQYLIIENEYNNIKKDNKDQNIKNNKIKISEKINDINQILKNSKNRDVISVNTEKKEIYKNLKFIGNNITNKDLEILLLRKLEDIKIIWHKIKNSLDLDKWSLPEGFSNNKDHVYIDKKRSCLLATNENDILKSCV
jgi:hypothetical protein